MDSQNAVPKRERRRPSRAELSERWAALLLAVLSLLVAFYALHIAKRTDAAVSSTSDTVTRANKNTEEIAKSLSTRYVGQFPGILPEIVAALKEAHKEISILTDVPGYAIYSSHDTFLDYEAMLRKTAQHIPIRIAVLTPPRRRQILQLQFGARSLEKLKKEDNYESFRKWAGPNTDKIKNITDFVDVIADAQNGIAAEFSQDMQVRQYDGDMAVYLWLVDDRVAVLSIPNLDRKNPEETAFITRDTRLISQLSNVFNSYWSSSH